MKILNTFVIFLGIWTLSSNFMVLTHQSLFTTVLISTVICSISFLYWFYRLRQKSVTTTQVNINHASGLFPSLSLGRLSRKHIIFIALFIAFITILTQNPLPFWLGSLILFPLVILFEFVNWDRPSQEVGENNWIQGFDQRKDWLWLILVCGLAVCIMLIVKSYDSDDSFYFNRGVVLANTPFEPMPDYWTLFPPELNAEFPYPTWPLIAYHDLIGALIWLLNMEVFPLIAFIVAPLLTILMVLAYSALFKQIAPQSWMWLSLIMVFILVSGGTSKHFVGSLSIPRLWQGKSIILHVMIPLVYLYGIRFGATGNWYDFALLTLAQISMFGLGSMAVWIAPIIAGTSILSGVIVFQPVQTVKRLVASIASSFYPLTVGVIVYVTTQQVTNNIRKPIVDILPILEESFGNIDAQVFWMAITLISVVLIPHKFIRVLIAVNAFFLTVIFANPLLAEYIASYVTTEPIYWRIFWMLPILIALAGVLVLPIEYSQKWKLGRLSLIGAFIFTLCLAYFYNTSIVTRSTLKVSNPNASYFELGFPALKVPADAFEVASVLVKTLPENSLISGDAKINSLIPMFRKQIYSISPRGNVVQNLFMIQNNNPEEYYLRTYLANYADGKSNYDIDRWTEALDRWSFDAIIVSIHIHDIESFYLLLVSYDYSRQIIGNYIIYTKNES